MDAVEFPQANSDLDDAQLMHLLALGRKEALGPLHRRYAPWIFGMAARTLDPATAEEIVQEVFLVVWRKSATFDPARGSFRAWVLRIAHLRVVNELRRRSRRPAIASSSAAQAAEIMTDPLPEPAEMAWNQHRKAVVQAAVEALPLPQKQALRLAFLEDMTHEQVAEFLNLPLGTAKSRIRAGLQTLRLRLAPLAAVGLALVVLLVLFDRQRAETSRQARALQLVASSDSVSRRLTASPGFAPALHGVYRGRPGTALAVLTISNFPPEPAGRIYRVWARHGTRWTALTVVHPDRVGHDLTILESPLLITPPDAIKVTLEPSSSSAAPTGPTVIEWSSD